MSQLYEYWRDGIDDSTTDWGELPREVQLAFEAAEASIDRFMATWEPPKVEPTPARDEITRQLQAMMPSEKALFGLLDSGRLRQFLVNSNLQRILPDSDTDGT